LPSYIYKNEIINCFGEGIRAGSYDNLFIKENRIIEGTDGIHVAGDYFEISGNYLEGCRINGSIGNSIIKNNIIKNSNGTAISGNVSKIINNISYNCSIGLSGSGTNQFSNNIIAGNEYAFSFLTDNHIIENEIIICNDELIYSPSHIYGNPIFRNCILDFELPPECIDGGGNIWVDGDFHLIEGSLAIDAGFDTLGYYYPFDLDYNHRVWDGDNNGTPIIDIGPYEFGSPAFGGIEGFTYNPSTGEPVDYVLLKINNQPGEFTFSDSLGNFEHKLTAGTYDVYAERVFYDDAILYEIEVNDGQFTQIQIPMIETVDVEEHTIPHSSYPIANLSNYPNPFNPSTNISFTLNNETTKNTELSIYNIKGQKVKTLLNEHLIKGTHSVVWNGMDSNNKHVSSGIYFYKISSGNESVMKKMLLLK
jgi:hypothetical protein